MSAGSVRVGSIRWVGDSMTPHWEISCRVAFATKKRLTANAPDKGVDSSTMAGANHIAGAEVRKRETRRTRQVRQRDHEIKPECDDRAVVSGDRMGVRPCRHILGLFRGLAGGPAAKR